MASGASRLFVLTFSQPRAELVAPERHQYCDPSTHLYLYKDDTWRWRMLESCRHCCKYSSGAIVLWRKAMRRRYPDLQMLWVREVKPSSGAFDVNVVCTGLPRMMRRTERGRECKRLWVSAGGGFMDLGDKYAGARSSGGLGRYIGKYLTKLAHRRMAAGFRRWGRSGGFAPEITMAQLVYEGPKLPFAYVFEGWVDMLDGTISQMRSASLRRLAPS